MRRSGRSNFLVWLSGDTSIVPHNNRSGFSLSRSLFGHSSRGYQGFGQEKIGGGGSKLFRDVRNSRELHEIAAGVTPSTLTRWFSSRFVRLNCQKYAQLASALQRPSCARHWFASNTGRSFPGFG